MIRILLLFYFVMTGFYACQASDSDSYYHFNMESGLPSDNIYSVIKDRLGYIWIASDKGVAKYDGHNFKVFTTDNGLPINDIWRLYEDNLGRIWLFNSSFELGYIKDDLYHPLKIRNGSESLYPIGIGALGPITVLFTGHDKERIITILINGHHISFPLHNCMYPFSKKLSYISFINEKYVWMFTTNYLTIRLNMLEPMSRSKVYNFNSTVYTIDSDVTIGDSSRLYTYKYKGTTSKR